MAHCVITGGSRGIGKATALALAAGGWSLTINYHNNTAAAEAVCAAALDAGAPQVRLAAADISDPEQAATMIKEAEKAQGPISGLVCNAGIIRTQFTALTSPDDWRKINATNLDGSFYVTKAVIRGMVRQRAGRIVYISSDAALLGDLMRAAYSSSKAGLLGLMRAVSREVASAGVTVNAITPGIITTDMTADIPETRRQKQLAAIPLGRFGEPGEVAAAVSFLMSDAASFITGQTLSVNGGLYM